MNVRPLWLINGVIFVFAVVIILGIVTSTATKNSQTPTTNYTYNCTELDDLLTNNSRQFYVSKFEQSKPKTPTSWRIQVESKDSLYKETTEHPDLCEAFYRAWTRLDAYNAYILNK